MFIVIDGIDGSGKSTQVKLLFDSLRNNTKKKITVTREPGGSNIAEQIRQILFLSELNDRFTEMLLFFAARRYHFLETVKPALDNNEIVICDRFIYSTIAYQGYGFGIDIALIKRLNAAILPKKYLPNITLILDIDVKTAINRAKKEGNTKYENDLGEYFFNKVKKGFIKLSNEKNSYLIDANLNINSIHNNITEIVRKHL
ncbi:MAG: dTMP kinase [Rickettsiaceae bacterium H1]|nr:dTMP kinase [Rickettsiaceae bacterium H1]